MSSKSSSYAISFAIVTLVVVALYLSGQVAPIVRSLADLIVSMLGGDQAMDSTASLVNLVNRLGGFPDYWTFVVVAVLAVVAIGLGAEPVTVLSAATIGGLLVLTVNQPVLIRYLTLAAALFSIGMYGMVVSRNAVRVLMSIELMLNAVNINLVAFAKYVDPIAVRGQLFAIFILTVAAAEAAVGLAIVLAIYRNRSTVNMEKFSLLKW